MSDYEFTDEEVDDAWGDADKRCECCGKKLAKKNRRRDSGWG